MRTKLKMLDAEESALKESIQRLREDLDELKRERLAKARDGSEGFPSDGMQPTSSMKIEEHEEEEEAEESDASDAQEEGNADKALGTSRGRAGRGHQLHRKPSSCPPLHRGFRSAL